MGSNNLVVTLSSKYRHIAKLTPLIDQFTDTKNSTGIVPNSIDEIAHNAVAIKWTPTEQAAKVRAVLRLVSRRLYMIDQQVIAAVQN